MRAPKARYVWGNPLPDNIAPFGPYLVPALHVAVQAAEHLLALQELHAVLVFVCNGGEERGVLAYVDVLLLLGVDEVLGRNVSVEQRLEIGQRIQLRCAAEMSGRLVRRADTVRMDKHVLFPHRDKPADSAAEWLPKLGYLYLTPFLFLGFLLLPFPIPGLLESCFDILNGAVWSMFSHGSVGRENSYFSLNIQNRKKEEYSTNQQPRHRRLSRP